MSLEPGLASEKRDVPDVVDHQGLGLVDVGPTFVALGMEGILDWVGVSAVLLVRRIADRMREGISPLHLQPVPQAMVHEELQGVIASKTRALIQHDDVIAHEWPKERGRLLAAGS